jgi:hypothetical protein
MTPELQSNIAVWRAKAAEGKLTFEEMKEAVMALRAGRCEASKSAQNAAMKRKKAIAAIPSAEDMMSELEGL